MTARRDIDDRIRCKQLWSRRVHALGWEYSKVAEKTGLKEGTVKSYGKKDAANSNAPDHDRIHQLSKLVVHHAYDVIRDSALLEAMHPLSREEFEEGVELPHGTVPGVVTEMDRQISLNDRGNRYRVSIVGSTGRFGHLTVPLEGQSLSTARERILDAAWDVYLQLAAPKTIEDMEKLVKSTLHVLPTIERDSFQLELPRSDMGAEGSWVAEVYGSYGRLKVVTVQQVGESKKDAVDRIVGTAWINYAAALEGVDSRLLVIEERAARKARFRELRDLFELSSGKIGELTGHTVNAKTDTSKAVDGWAADAKAILPNAGVLDVLEACRLSWASDLVLAAEMDRDQGKLDIPFLEPTLPDDFADRIRNAMAQHQAAAVHWRKRVVEAREAGFVTAP